MAVACGNDIIRLAQPQGDDYGTTETVPTDYQDAGTAEAVGLGVPEPLLVDAQAVLSEEVPTLCLVPDPRFPELLSYVRASTGRFRERLGLPVALCDTGVPILVEEEIVHNGEAVSGIAHTNRPCVMAQCNGDAYIAIVKINLYAQMAWLPNLLDHEIGHILSTKLDKHLPPGHIMSEVNKRENRWTQEDVDLWCSGSPCTKTSWQDETTDLPDSGLPVAVSDAGTSRLSIVETKEAGPYARSSGDAGD